MQKVEEVLRLRWGAKLSLRAVAQALGIGKTTVLECLRRAEAAGLSWPLPSELDGAGLVRLLYPQEASRAAGQWGQPDWAQVHRQLRAPGVTLFLLWQEYREREPAGYAYSRFCELYAQWRGRVDVAMRQSHRAGEKLFVDYAGQPVDIVDPTRGEVAAAQIFVAVLGASNYTFAEATRTQGLADWIGSHGRALAFFNGVPSIIVPDNLRTAVSKSSRYEPDLNLTSQEFARHYGVAVIPARVRKPRDKAEAEGGVLLVERWILARLRHQTFFSLTTRNRAIAELLATLNARPFKKLEGSRRSHFEAIDRPALRPLPSAPYEYAEWRKARVAPNIHLPAMRSRQRGGYTTLSCHMPEAHRRYLDWTPERLLRWAAKHGPATQSLIARLLNERPHPQQGFNAAFGVLRLAKDYGADRLEAASARALAIGTVSYTSIASILAKGLDRRPLPQSTADAEPIVRANLRGAEYYH